MKNGFTIFIAVYKYFEGIASITASFALLWFFKLMISLVKDSADWDTDIVFSFKNEFVFPMARIVLLKADKNKEELKWKKEVKQR